MAEASDLSLEVRFTEPDAPLYVDVSGDLADTMFVIAASHLQSFSPQNSQTRQSDARAQVKGKKRPLEEDAHHGNAQEVARERTRSGHANRPAKPMKVVHRADPASIAREMHPPPSAQQPQPSWAILTAAQQQYRDPHRDAEDDAGALPSQPPFRGASQASQRGGAEREPLFLPSSQLSQLPRAAEEAIIGSGLGIEHMTAEELEDMLEGDAEEVEFATQRSFVADDVQVEAAESALDMEEEEDWQIEDDMDFGDAGYGQQGESFELIEDIEMEPTQNDGGTKVRGSRVSYDLVCSRIEAARCSGRCLKTRGSCTAAPKSQARKRGYGRRCG